MGGLRKPVATTKNSPVLFPTVCYVNINLLVFCDIKKKKSTVKSWQDLGGFVRPRGKVLN